MSADTVLEWNRTACDIVAASELSGVAMYRAMAYVQTAAFHAAEAVTPGSDDTFGRDDKLNTKLAAALAEANRLVLLQVVPSQHEAIERAYATALAKIADDPTKSAGLKQGEYAARTLLARFSGDQVTPESYRPRTHPGVWVPTTVAVGSTWPNRTPWFMTRADQFRPGSPPDLRSEVWERDLAEVKSLGAKVSTARTAEQTAIAQFWEATAPSLYFAVARSIAEQPERTPRQNARLLARVAQAMDDTLISVFDAKYHYGFWRPITAIRNADHDNNAATERDASWVPFITTPPHPEYPCAHCALAAAVGVLLRAEVGSGTLPRLSSTSPTAPGVVRSWTSIEAFVTEVAEARIYDGVHYRTSTDVGTAIGTRVGELVRMHSESSGADLVAQANSR